MKIEDLDLKDFEIVYEPVPENETPRAFLFRMTGQDYTSLEDVSWEEVREVGLLPFITRIIARHSKPQIFLRRRADDESSEKA